MTDLLIRLFIKDSENVKNRVVRRSYGVMAGVVGIVCNVILFTAKLITGILSGAISITADAVNNLSDAGSSIITLVGFKMAGKRADRQHPYGHGRIEYITGLLVSLTIMLVGVELLKTSFDKAVDPDNVGFSLISIAVLAGSVLVKLWMAFFNRKLGKKLNSSALKATSLDSLSDCITTTAVIIGAVIGLATGINLDAYLGMFVACFIIFTGFKSASESLNPLIGEAPDKEFVAEIEKTVLSDDRVLGLHDVLVHSYGATHIAASLHAELPADINLLTAHTIVDEIEAKIKSKFDCDITIHADPIVTNDKIIAPVYSKVLSTIKSISPALAVQNFRITQGYDRSYVLFNVIVPNDTAISELSDEELEKMITSSFNIKDKEFIMTIERESNK